MTKWAVCSIVCGVMCIGFGGSFLYCAIADPQGSMFAFILICGLIGLAGGACGIAGGLSINGKKEKARKLLLTAAVLLLPYALVFFLLFMVARDRAASTEDVWGEKEGSMKKAFVLVILALLLAVSGCSYASSSAVSPSVFTLVPLEESVFWNFGTEEGYEKVYASHSYSWTGEDLLVIFYVFPHGLGMNDVLKYATKEKKNGTEYTFVYSSLFWDDFGTGGRKDTAKMGWTSEGYDYLLVGCVEDETVPLDFVNTDVAIQLESGDFSAFKHLEPAGEVWRAEFRSGFEIATLQVYTPPADKIVKEKIAKGSMTLVEASDCKYYFYEEYALDGTYITNMVWKTNIGYVVLSEIVPAMYRDEMPFVYHQDSFGNPVSLTEKLGGEILPLPEK